ncbi:MAG: hypothetical protein KME28_21660 [Pelatocladus maniniholoensis HA4357-MV3]|jgi:hypothetical protein|uniref:Uncharacterized protein n=1 Tax=Pelatocladus maniniholoensis HA4357-MV3 TaxID=1117104 RepID=A0A9E3LUW2_9NOST|nr:hypothetical protein [Pelatocladus maniniholoensis HA4357-MV3]BAZ68561.1 hypothetical protein NIES4106_33250 [Fischerella sp. NIES-4106]
MGLRIYSQAGYGVGAKCQYLYELFTESNRIAISPASIEAVGAIYV